MTNELLEIIRYYQYDHNYINAILQCIFSENYGDVVFKWADLLKQKNEYFNAIRF